MEKGAAQIRVGLAGWSYDDWKGIVYPAGGMKATHPLTFLAHYFDTIEINSSFYHPPNPRYCEGWVKKIETNPAFRFTAKAWDRFTHKRERIPEAAEINHFKTAIAPLHEAGRLGALLFQFPWSFRRTPENRQWLARLFDAFDAYPLALELRHASWEQATLFDGLKERHIAFCNIDQPLFEDSIPPSSRVTAPFAYVRLHGRNTAHWFREGAGRNERYDYCYSEEELAPWISRLRAMQPQVNELFVVTNNHYRGQAVVNALEIQAALGKTVPALPPRLLAAYPRLVALFRPGGSAPQSVPT